MDPKQDNIDNYGIRCGGSHMSHLIVPCIIMAIPMILLHNDSNKIFDNFEIVILFFVLAPYIFYHLLRIIFFRFIICENEVLYRNLFGLIIRGTIDEIGSVYYNTGAGDTGTPKIVITFKNKKVVLKSGDKNFYKMRDYLISKGFIKKENTINPDKWLDDLSNKMASPLVKLINKIKGKE